MIPGDRRRRPFRALAKIGVGVRKGACGAEVQG